MIRNLSLLTICLVITLLFAGCGGGGTKNSTPPLSNSITAVIDWTPPSASTRYLPSYAGCVRLEVYAPGNPTPLAAQTVLRPAAAPWVTTIKLTEDVTAATYTLKAFAYAGSQVIGSWVASTEVSIPLALNQQHVTQIAPTLTTSIDHIDITTTHLTVDVGDDLDLACTAFNSVGLALLVPSSSLTWSIVSGGSYGTLTPAGHLHGTSAGTIRVRVSEVGAGLSKEADVTVQAPPATVRFFSTAVEYTDWPLTCWADGNWIIQGLAPCVFSESDYYFMPAGTHTILTRLVSYASIMGGSADLTFASSKYYILFFQRYGEPVLIDATTPAPSANKAKVRFINTHMLTDTFEFCMYAHAGTPSASNTMGTVTSTFSPTAYQEIDPGTYEFNAVSPPGSYANKAYTASEITVNAGDIYTIAVVTGWTPAAPNGTVVIQALKEN